MSTNRPESGRLDQSGVAGGAEQHDAAAPAGGGGHERRPVGERGPGVGGDVGRRFGEDLAADLHLLGDREAGERRAGGERGERGGLAPGKGAAELAVAGEQANGEQGIVVRGIGAGIGHARTGEADEEAALLDPGDERGGIGGLERDVGEHQDGEGDAREGRQGFPGAVRRTGRERGGDRTTGRSGECRRPPPSASKPTGRRRQRSSSSITPPAEVAPPITRREISLRISGGSAMSASAAVRPAGRVVSPRARVRPSPVWAKTETARSTGWARPSTRAIRRPASKRGGRADEVVDRVRAALVDRGAGGGEGAGESRVGGGGDAVGQIDHVAGVDGAERGGGGGAIGGPRFRADRGEAGAKFGGRHGGGRRGDGVGLGAGGGQQHGGAAGPLGTVERTFGDRHAGRPVAGCGPAIVDDEQDRAFAMEPGGGVEHRAS